MFRKTSLLLLAALTLATSASAFYNDPNSATGVGITAKVLTTTSMGLSAAGIATTYKASQDAEDRDDETSHKAWKAGTASDATALGFFSAALIANIALGCTGKSHAAAIAAVAGGVLSGTGVLVATVPGIAATSIGTARSKSVSTQEKAGIGTTVASFVSGALTTGMYFWNAILLSQFMQASTTAPSDPTIVPVVSGGSQAKKS